MSQSFILKVFYSKNLQTINHTVISMNILYSNFYNDITVKKQTSAHIILQLI